MHVQFRGMTHYTGPIASIRRELKNQQPDHALRAKIQQGNEALYISGRDLARCVKEKFNIDVGKELLEAVPDNPVCSQPLKVQNAYAKKMLKQHQQFHQDMNRALKKLKPEAENPFLDYYDEAFARNRGRDEYNQPIRQVIYFEETWGHRLDQEALTGTHS